MGDEQKLMSAFRTGVYAMVGGPTYESPAEARFIKSAVADAVGMSTVPEVIVAIQQGVKCLAMSLISNKVVLKIDDDNEPNHAEVLGLASPATGCAAPLCGTQQERQGGSRGRQALSRARVYRAALLQHLTRAIGKTEPRQMTPNIFIPSTGMGAQHSKHLNSNQLGRRQQSAPTSLRGSTEGVQPLVLQTHQSEA